MALASQYTAVGEETLLSLFRDQVPQLWEHMRSKVYFIFLMKLSLAAGNALYAAYAYWRIYHKPRDSMFDVTAVFIAAIEAFIILGSWARILGADVPIIFQSEKPFSSVNMFRDNLSLAGGFSALMFLPVPAKVSDWFARRRTLTRFYVMEIPALKRNGVSLFDCNWVSLLIERNRRRVGCRKILILGEFVFVPIIAFTMQVKMASLPDVRSLEDWDFQSWLAFGGIINQTSHKGLGAPILQLNQLNLERNRCRRYSAIRLGSSHLAGCHTKYRKIQGVGISMLHGSGRVAVASFVSGPCFAEKLVNKVCKRAVHTGCLNDSCVGLQSR